MSRALNIKASEADIVATCSKKNIGISAIETLASGGTRVVLNNATDTATIAKSYGSKVIAGEVTRVATRLNRSW
jgi:hypothetical protein